MESQALVIGRRYGYREKRTPGQPLLKVKLLDKVGRKGKVKIRFEDGPHPGLEEYVASRQLVVPWGERRALLRDEERAERLERHAPGRAADRALVEAASAVLESTGEPGAAVMGAVSWFDEDELQRIVDRAGLTMAPTELHPYAYRDRHGRVHLPLEGAVALAKAFAAAEPRTVTQYLDDHEEELRLRGNQPGERFYHEHLRDLSPGYALARQWAGLEEEGKLLREEISRLRMLVSRAARDLEGAGQEHKAKRLLRALEGR